MFSALSAVKVTKFIVSGIVGIGAGKIAKSVITNQVNPETLIDKVTTVAGAWAIAGMVAEASKNYTDSAIDEMYENGSKLVEYLKLKNKLARISLKESTFEQEGLDPEDFVQDPITKRWSAIKVVDEPITK